MATIDNYTVKIGVDGLQALDNASASFTRLDGNVQQVQKSILGFRATIIANQIQDIAVQAEMGTNWTRILAQQLPQLGTAFGAVGAVAGSVAAIFFATLQPALKAAGIDIRNLDELLKDSEKSIKAFQEAQQKAALSNTELRATYGDLADGAKRFFDEQKKTTDQIATVQLSKTITELKDKYGFLTQSVIDAQRAQEEFATSYMGAEAMIGAGAGSLAISLRAKWLGLSVEQAEELGKRMSELDAKAPEKNLDVITGISKYLRESVKDQDTLLRLYEKVIEPLQTANNLVLEQQKNLQAGAKMATELAVALLNLQSKYLPDIGAARRNFDQVLAFRLEGELKVAEYARQLQNKSGLDEKQRSTELAAFKNKTQIEVNEKIKDFQKAQQETFYAQQLSNEAKESQLRVQRNINNLQMEQIDGINYELVLEQDRLKAVYDQQQALVAIDELRRKNLITEERAARLTEQAASIRKSSDELALQNIQKIQLENARAIRLQVEALATQNTEKVKAFELDQKIFLMSTNRQNAEKKQLELENARARELAGINNNTRLSDAEKLDAQRRINLEYDKGLKLIEQELKYREEMDANMKKGAADRAKQIIESYTPFKVGGMMVDSMFNQMTSAIDRFVETGKFSFADFSRSVIMEIEKILLKEALLGMVKTSGIGAFFGLPGMAEGGPVSGGQPYIIGEKGPELFIPQTAGNIVPNNKLGGGTTIINNISAVDAKSVAQLFAENRMTLLGTVEQARRELPLRTR